MMGLIAGRADTASVARLAKRGLLGVAGLSLVCNLAALAVPLFNMQVFNRVLTTRDTATLYALVAGLAVSLLMWAMLDTLRGLALDTLAGRITLGLSSPLMRAVAADWRGAGAPAEALADLETLRSFVASPYSTAPFDLMWTPVLLLVLLMQHWGFAALAGVCCLILTGLSVAGDGMSRREMLEANQASAASLRRAADAVCAAEAVVALGMLPALTRRWEAGQREASALVHRAVLGARAIAALTSALRMAMTGGMVALGLVLALNGLSSGGAMVASNMILARLLLPFGQMAQTRRRWVDALAAWQRVRAGLEMPTPQRYTLPMPAPVPRLTIENLSYMPPRSEAWALRGVSFTVEPGESIGVIGPSSSGKSTLLRLVLGMMQPNAGGVYLDGTNTYLWQREDFARHAGYMPQGLCLLDETVAENIAGRPEPDLGAVLAAAKRAGAHPMIASLPQGYATRVRGAALSSGQRQRVALARALFNQPGLLVLDEPTAFLDDEGEARMKTLLPQLKAGGVTVLLVSHRPSLLTGVDKLLVLRDGMVAQFGARADVMEWLGTPVATLVPVRLLPVEATA